MALCVVDLVYAARFGLLSILPPEHPQTCNAALIFSASAGDTGLSASATVLMETAATAIKIRFIVLSCGWVARPSFAVLLDKHEMRAMRSVTSEPRPTLATLQQYRDGRP